MDKLNKGLFAFASYNAGPSRVRQLRKEAAKRGLDPNVWFGNVEQVASERIMPAVGRDTPAVKLGIIDTYWRGVDRRVKDAAVQLALVM